MYDAMSTPINFRTLDLNLLRVFDAIMAEKSLTRAALIRPSANVADSRNSFFFARISLTLRG